jgi:HlyD family secretion protein
MRTLVILGLVLVAAGVALAAGYKPLLEYWERRSMPKWRTAEVARGNIVSVVNATGTVKPVLQISVGSFVSGPIDPEFKFCDSNGNLKLDKSGKPTSLADFNDEVKEGQVLAKIQDTIYKANLERDDANLETRKADVRRVDALLKQARRDEKRAYALRSENEGFISGAEIDKVTFGRESLEAQYELANAAVLQAKAQYDFSKAQLGYTEIKAPKDGIIINRKIDPGQTVAAQFQTPEMFILAPDMRKEMFVHASVDEADIGLIREAKNKLLPVTFTVDAYPDDLFQGKIEEIRLGSTTTQNVVTYPVVVGAANQDLKLLPGMTASISFEVDRRTDVVKIPNSALRFFPLPLHVRVEDKPLLEGRATAVDKEEPHDGNLSAEERSEARRKRNLRHVWVQERYKLRAVPVTTGLSDSQFTELVTGELKSEDKLVIGIQPPTATTGQ